MLDERFYFRFAKHYNVDKDTAVDYNVFLKNLGTNNDLNLKYDVGSQGRYLLKHTDKDFSVLGRVAPHL